MRFQTIFLVLIALLLGGCQQGDYRAVKSYTIEQFMNTTSIFGSSFSHDETTILFSSNETGIYNVYSLPVTGGEPTQITDSKDNSIFVTSWFPNDNRMLFRSDQGGNEIWHIYLRLEDGTVQDLTPKENARSLFFSWAFDKKSFFYLSNKRTPKFMDLYEMDIEKFSSKMIYRNDEGYNAGDISNDKRYLALSKTVTNHNSEMYLYDLKTNEMRHLSPHEGDVRYSPATFSIDSKSLFFKTDEGSEFSYIKKYDISSREASVIEQVNWDIAYTYFSRNGKYRVTGINNDAITEIKVYNTMTGKPVELPSLPLGAISSVNISASEKLMTFYHNGSKSPNNLYVFNFETNKYIKLTNTMNPHIDAENLVEGTVIRYKSFDGLEIPAILYKPHHIKPGEKAPALVDVHGGPGGQSRIGYRAQIQYLVNHGYVVLAVNNRGSSGYGKTFYKLDDLKHGEGDLDDCVAAKKYLISTGYVDANKIGIIGGSYGGYMVLAALAFRPDAFEVGVNLFGVSNWVRTLKSIPPWWAAFKDALYKEMGNPETDEDYLRRISPLFHADKIRKPLIVLQGANDPRVIKPESDEIVEAVKKHGVPVEYVVFEDEGHGFVKKENQIKGNQAILAFLDKYLKQSQ